MSTRRLLVVDDDAQLRSMMAEVLVSAGFRVDTAADGRQALERIDSATYDVIVSDISMPGLGGVELLRHVRERDVDLPVILITGDPALPTVLQAFEHGAFRYLVKPVKLDVLEDAVTRAARLHALARVKRQALQLLGDELGDPATLESRLSAAMRSLWLAFQPIVQAADGRVYAYEAFVRAKEASLAMPSALFGAAERLGGVPELGRAIRAAAAACMHELPAGVSLFLNLHSRELDDDELYDRGSVLTAWASRVVLEITERAPLDAVRGLQDRVARLRTIGYRLAVDDLGAGYAGLSTFAQLQPEIVKLDMSLVRGVDAEPTKLAIVRSMRQLCTDLGILVVAEGVETAAERDALVDAGCPLLQGYLFARPASTFTLML